MGVGKFLKEQLWTNRSGKGKALSALFGACALGTTLAVGGYGALYGWVASNDVNLPLLNWPATEGQWKGQIIRLSHKGTFPCDSYEGIIQTSASSRPDSATSDAFNFSVRKFQGDVLAQIHDAIDNNRLVVLTYRDSPLEFPEGSWNRCIQGTDHTPVEVRAIAAP